MYVERRALCIALASSLASAERSNQPFEPPGSEVCSVAAWGDSVDAVNRETPLRSRESACAASDGVNLGYVEDIGSWYRRTSHSCVEGVAIGRSPMSRS